MIRVPTIMHTSALTIRNLNGYDHLISSGPCIQYVRWKRKPIWLPTAKSKLFRVPVRPVIPKEEAAELLRLSNNYRTYMKSLKTFFHDDKAAKRVQFDHEHMMKKAEEDFEKCSKINEYWNKQVAVEREFRLAEEREKREEEIKLKLKEKEQREFETQIRVDTEIRMAKKVAVTFITSANIDQAIEDALETIVNHNVAIDLNGKLHGNTKILPESDSTTSTV